MKKSRRNILLISSFLMTALVLSCCKGAKSQGQSAEGQQSEISDSLDGVYERIRIGDYIYEVYNGVSCPGSITLRDSLGRVVAEGGLDGAGGESYMSYFFDEKDKLSSIYWGWCSETFSLFREGVDPETEVKYLTEGCKKDTEVESFLFERDNQGKTVRVHSARTQKQIACAAGGEITYKIYKYDGCATNGSLLRQGGYLEIEFYVKNPQDSHGNWEEATYNGYEKTQFWKFVNNKPAKAEAVSPSTGATLAKVKCTLSGDSLLMDIENLVDSTFECKVFLDNQLLVADKKSRWGTILEKKKIELTSSGEIICNSEKYDYSSKALKPLSPYKVKKDDVDLMTCFRNIFVDL